jgi:hypothetical protein
MDIFNINEVQATSKGIIEIGSVTIFSNNNEYMFEIEEHNINGNHEFKVFLSIEEDNESLNLNIDNGTGEILDEQFVNFIQDEYQRLTQM